MNPYSQVPENRDNSGDGGFAGQNPQVNSNYQQPVGILHGPGYKLVQAQSKVSKYAWYAKIFAWVFLIMGGFKVITAGLKFLDAEEIDIEFNDSQMETEDLEIPAGPIAFANLLDCISGAMTMLMGYLFLQTSKEPTRASTWGLWKKTFLIIVIQFILMAIAYVAVFVGFGMAIDDWMRDERRSPGEYRLRHKNSGQEFRIEKPENGERPDDEDIREMEGFSAIIFMSLMMAFAFSCCISMMCSSCVLGGLYKFHYTTRELEIISDLPSVNQVNMQQYPAHQPQPQNIVRGHVVMMPQPAQQP